MKLWGLLREHWYGRGSKAVPFEVSKEALEAAKDAFKDLSREHRKSLFVLPYDECAFEFPPVEKDGMLARVVVWMAGYQHALDNGLMLSPSDSVVPEGHTHYTAAVSMVLFDKQTGRIVKTYEGDLEVIFDVENLNEKIVVNANRDDTMDAETAVATIEGVCTILCLLNSPSLASAQWVDQSGVPSLKKFSKPGRRIGFTRIKLSQGMREYMRYKHEPHYTDETGQHWVRRHPKTYWTGKRGSLKPTVRLIGPYPRGNPALGEREARYRVT